MAVFSLEMSKESLLTRMICAGASVDQQKFRAGYLNQDERRRLQQTRPNWCRRRCSSTTRPASHMMDIHAKLRRLQAASTACRLVMVDYLQLMSRPRPL